MTNSGAQIKCPAQPFSVSSTKPGSLSDREVPYRQAKIPIQTCNSYKSLNPPLLSPITVASKRINYNKKNMWPWPVWLN